MNKGMHIFVENETKLDISQSDFKGLDCLKLLPSLDYDRLQTGTPEEFFMVTINSFENDTIDFNIEKFKAMKSGKSFRIGNFGGRTTLYSKEMLLRTVCLFVNK